MKVYENKEVRKRMVTLDIGLKELSHELGYAYNTVAHWMAAPLTEAHKQLVEQALDRIEERKENNG